MNLCLNLSIYSENISPVKANGTGFTLFNSPEVLDRYCFYGMNVKILHKSSVSLFIYNLKSVRDKDKTFINGKKFKSCVIAKNWAALAQTIVHVHYLFSEFQILCYGWLWSMLL